MKRTLAAALAATTILAACGGGDDEPTVFTAADESFSVEFPGEPQRETEQTDVVGYDVELDFYIYERDDGAFMVNQFDYTPLAEDAGFSPEELAAFVDLDAAVDGAMSGAGATATSVESITVEGRDGRFIEFTGSRAGQDFVGVAQVMLDGLELYQVMALGPSDADADLRSFVESFEFLAEPLGVGG